MTPGRFIALEGGEGAGKSTQARLLVEALRTCGRDVELTREPGGTSGAEAIRALLLDGAHDWGSRAEAMLFAAARADHVAQLIRPALEAGKWVVCDRFLDSSRAYQGGGGGLDDADVRALHAVGSAGLLPDLTLLLRADPKQVAERLARRQGADRIEGKGSDYHARVARAFDDFAAAEPARFVVVDAGGSVETTHAAIMDAVDKAFCE